jgi:predicted permease
MAVRLHHRVYAAVRSFVFRRAVERELDEELRFHLEQMEAREAARGADASTARLQAKRRFGSLAHVREVCGDMRTLRPLEDVLQDVRFGIRLLARSPVFTAVAVLSLAIGIGGSSAIFSLINAIVLRPLPVPQPGDLYLAQVTRPGEVNARFSWPVFDSAREMLAGRAELCAQSSIEGVRVSTGHADDAAASPQGGRMQLVSGDCFNLLRQRAQAGRLLGPGDNRTAGGHPVAVMSDSYWSRRFSRDPAVIGRQVLVNGVAVTVVGVTMPEFLGTTIDMRGVDLWAPIMMQAELEFAGTVRVTNGDTARPWLPQRELAWLTVVLRAQKDRLPAITEGMNLILRRESMLVTGYQTNADLRKRLEASRVALVSGSHGFSPRGELAGPLVLLLAMTGVLLAVACGNIASLLLARATTRHREIAIRCSTGAVRGRLVRQLLTESVVLALCGGALGLVIAAWGSTALPAALSRGEPVAGIDVRLDWRVVAFTFSVSIATALLFGLLPALRSTRVSMLEALNAQARGVIGLGKAGGRTSRFLIAGQMAFSLVLLILAALFGRSLQELLRADVGFDRQRVLTTRIDPRAAGYTVTELPQLHRRLLEGIAAIPGVTAASLSTNGPFAGSGTRRNFEAEGYTRGPDERPVTELEWVTPDYFRTVGLTIKRGRTFDATDLETARKVTLINETLARRYFGDENAIGKRWGYNRDFGLDGFEIIGIVEDARYSGRDLRLEESLNMAYLPAGQEARLLQSLEVRVDGDPSAFPVALRNGLRRIEPRLPVLATESVDERVGRALDANRLLVAVTAAVGVLALCLASIGLFGAMSYAVTRRTIELGVRMALGAERRTVLGLIMREALSVVLVGLVVALPLAFLAARATSQLLFGIVPYDVRAYGVAVAVLVLVTSLAAYLPARRAAQLDPMNALRAD